MLRVWLFLFLYGSLTATGLFLVIFWSGVARRRKAEIDGQWLWPRDRYYILASGIAVASSGIMVLSAGRLYGNLAYGLSPILQRTEAFAVGIGLGLQLFGYYKLVLLADLEKRPPRFTWLKVVGVASIVWLVLSGIVAQHVPLTPNDQRAKVKYPPLLEVLKP